MHECTTISCYRALACAVGLLAAALAQAAPLSEDQALRLSLGRSEISALGQARAEAAEADLQASAQWSNPTLALARETAGNSRELSLQLSQSLNWSGRRELNIAAAGQRRAAVSAEHAAYSGERAAELRLAFHEVLRLQAELRATQDWQARFQRLSDVVDKLARAGEVAGYDRRRLARERLGAEARTAVAHAELSRARAQLAALLGQVDEPEASGALLPEPPAALAELQARLALRPDLAALAARAQAARSEQAAAGRLWPELTLGLGGKQVDDGSRRESGLMLSVSLPLPLFDRRQPAQRDAAARALSAESERSLALAQAQAELAGRHRQVQTLIATAQRYRREAVTPSAELVAIAESAYRAGEGGVLELLDAYRGALDSELLALDLEWQARRAQLELEKLTGSQPL